VWISISCVSPLSVTLPVLVLPAWMLFVSSLLSIQLLSVFLVPVSPMPRTRLAAAVRIDHDRSVVVCPAVVYPSCCDATCRHCAGYANDLDLSVKKLLVG
jgi:hypothetical protein